MNKIFLMGNLGRDVETKQFDWGMTATFSMATRNPFKNKKTGEYESIWHYCEATGKTAEIIAGKFAKGSPIMVEGYQDNQQYEKDGVKKSISKVKVQNFYFVGGGSADKPEDNRKPNTDVQVPF